MRNARVPSSVFLVFIWNNINVIKKNYIYVLLDNMDAIFLIFLLYLCHSRCGHQKNTKMSSTVPIYIYIYFFFERLKKQINFFLGKRKREK
jgi:hypothetical protein